MALLVAIISLFYIANSQEGIGCMWKTCPTPGQVRINAIFSSSGDYLGGCNCGCDPALGDPSSPKYCNGIVNFNPNTQEGDCSCTPNTPPQNPNQPQNVPPNSAQTTPPQPHTTIDPHGAGAGGAPHEPTEVPEPTYPTG